MLDKPLFIRVRGKVLGPFDLAKLKALRDRGQFGRFHEVSQDRRTWQPATTLAELFPAEAAATSAAEAAATGVPAAEVIVEAPLLASPVTSNPSAAATDVQDRPEWYYMMPQGTNQGPVPQQQLLTLLQSGVITPATLVWKQGMANWTALSSPATGLSPFAVEPPWDQLPSSRRGRARRWPVALLVTGAVVVLGLLVLSWVPALNWLRNRDPVSTNPQVIHSLTDDKDIAGAVCLVACGVHVVDTDSGTHGDMLFGHGSGFAISPEGHILSNKHVIEGIQKLKDAEDSLDKLRREKHLKVKPTVWIFFGRQKYNGEILYVSELYDLTILKVERQHVPFFKLSSSDKLPRGKKVVACGFPGVAQDLLPLQELVSGKIREKSGLIDTIFKPRDFEFSMTDGIISRVTTEEVVATRWVQHNANINPGNSGGPLLAENGAVLGINTLGHPTAAVYLSLLLPQVKPEIEKYVPGLVWE